MPESVSTTSMEKAEYLFRYGTYSERLKIFQYEQQKRLRRWGEKPDTFLLNDFDKLLGYLFTDNYQQLLKYKNRAEKVAEKVKLPITKLDKLKKIWESLLPHRELIIQANAILTQAKYSSNNPYNASQMSDGERVIFYLIGECLCAYENGVIVIDEPELHIHKSIQGKLWDLIEQARPDCLFIYLTHDLDFAATRTEAKKICLTSYDGQSFDWYEIPQTSEIPENVYLEILGSRCPILFVEGTNDSLDLAIFQYIYPDFTIKPLGPCEKIIESTKAFNSTNSLHYISAYRIIDRDYKSDEHLQAYEEDKVYAISVAEVENLFLLEEVLLAVAKQYCCPEPQEVVGKIKSWVFEEFNKLKEEFALRKTSSCIDMVLHGFDGKAKNIDVLNQKINKLTNEINVNDYYKDQPDDAERIIESKNYNELLKIFNHKGLSKQVSKNFGLQPKQYTETVKNIIRSGNTEIIDAMRQKTPSFS